MPSLLPKKIALVEFEGVNPTRAFAKGGDSDNFI
jgi:hypothetical protein